MTLRAPAPMASWLWPVVLVTAMHLLSTSGTWWITDHGEILAVANHFMATGHLDLNDLEPGFEEWTRVAKARGTAETRFLPLSILILVPFLALDHLVGWRDPAAFKFVHLQGHVCIGLGLALIGRYWARTGARSQTSALGVLLLGLNWPVWMIARRLGPEPILFALLSAFATGGIRTRLIVLVLLPWVHATGPLLGLGALLWLGVKSPPIQATADWRSPAVAWICGVSSLLVFWNLPVHGSFLLGGYGHYSSDPFFATRNPIAGGLALMASLIFWTLPVWFLFFRDVQWKALSALILWAPLVGFLGAFSTPEPERRLAPLLAPWLVTVMASRSPLATDQALGLAVLSLLSGVIGLSLDFADLVVTPFGAFTGPILLLVRLAFVEAHPLQAALIGVLLLGLIAIAGSRTIRSLSGGRPELGRSASLHQNSTHD